MEKTWQSLNNLFRRCNLTALVEPAHHLAAEDQAAKAHDYRERGGLEQAFNPERGLGAQVIR